MPVLRYPHRRIPQDGLSATGARSSHAMRDLLSWNLSLGRWAGVHVRLHVFFLLFALVTVHVSMKDSQDRLLWYAVAGLAILLVSVLLHEFGHCFAALKVGGSAERIVVWPFGGLAQLNVPHEPRSELLTALAGPLVNLSIAVLAAVLLIILQGVTVFRPDPHSLANPLSPPVEANGFSWLAALKLVFWINWVLVLVNLLPAFPLDGGGVLRSALWQKFGYRSAVLLVARAAKLTALALWVVAWLVYEPYPSAPLPLALVGVFLFFSAKQEADRLHDHDSDEAEFGYDFSQGYTSLEKNLAPPRRRGPGPFKRWLENRRAGRVLRQRQIEEEEERRVDDVLARLHASGLRGLSDEDRALLDRVSARYRNRQRG